MATKVTMPQLGESVVEGTVGKVRVAVGDRVLKDQPLVEILTDKADTEVPSPVGGVVTALPVKEGDVVRVGDVLIEIEESASLAAATPSASSSAREASPPSAASTPAPAAAPAPATGSTPSPVASASFGSLAAVPSTPSARKAAREHAVDLAALASGAEGTRITRQDVLRAAIGTAAVPAAARPSSAAGDVPSPLPAAPSAASSIVGRPLAFQVPPYVPRPGDEVIPFNRRRRIIADHMVYSKLTSPHVVTVAECDLHRTSRLREQHKHQLKKEGVNLTYLAFVCAAVVRALREHRVMNARVLDDAYVLLRDINLGIAVETPDGLVVPVVKNADDLTVRGLAKAIDDLARRARDGKLTPDDLAGKTFTVSNPGLKGNLFGGAIISQPNVGILRIGEIQKRTVVVEHEGEDLIALRPVMFMALSYDHRIVDGVAANAFLYRVTELLEAGDFVV